MPRRVLGIVSVLFAAVLFAQEVGSASQIDSSGAHGLQPGTLLPLHPQGSSPPRPKGGRILVRYRHSSQQYAQASVARNSDARIVKNYSLVSGLKLLKLSPGEDQQSVIRGLEKDPRVEYAQPDSAFQLQDVQPDDALWSDLWGMSFIHAPTAWSERTGDPTLPVAVIDTGVDINHPDLKDNIWTNPDEIAGNGVDDDHNGYIDDVHGWNFVEGNNDVTDTYGHGTHVAGTIGARGNNGIGVAGVNWNTSIVPLRVCGNSGCDTSAIVAAIQYAIDKGIKISNNSYGGGVCDDQAMHDAVNSARSAGHLFVAAAGNDNSNNDRVDFCPANWGAKGGSDNVVSVGAIRSDGSKASFSNHGLSVDLAAPGQDILSTIPFGKFGFQDDYGSISGTSMATPHVVGAAALLWSKHPDWDYKRVKQTLLGTVQNQGSFHALSGGVLDLSAALTSTEQKYFLALEKSGTGMGTVIANGTDLSCLQGSCDQGFPNSYFSYSQNSSVTLHPVPNNGSVFAGWSGDCSGTGDCTLQNSSAARVWARFNHQPSGGDWSVQPLSSPPGRKAVLGSTVPYESFWGGSSFFQTSMSGSGEVRAKAIYNVSFDDINACSANADSSSTGGVWIQRWKDGSWQDDGFLSAPSEQRLSPPYRCERFGLITRLSRDGSTLLVTRNPGVSGEIDLQRAYIYHRDPEGWNLQTVLSPTLNPSWGSSIDSFGMVADISSDGSRVAIAYSYEHNKQFAFDVYHRTNSIWNKEYSALGTKPSNGGLYSTYRVRISGSGKRVVFTPLKYDHGIPDPSRETGQVEVYNLGSEGWSKSYTIPTQTAGENNTHNRSNPAVGIALSADGNSLVVGGYSDNHSSADMAPGFLVYPLSDNSYGTAQYYLPQASINCTPNLLVTRIVCSDHFSASGYNTHQGRLEIIDRGPEGWHEPKSHTLVDYEDGKSNENWGIGSERSIYWGYEDNYGFQNITMNNSGDAILASIDPMAILQGDTSDSQIGYQASGPAADGDLPALSLSWTTPPDGNPGENLVFHLNADRALTGVDSADFENKGTAQHCSILPQSEGGTDIVVIVRSCSNGSVQLKLSDNSLVDQNGYTYPAQALQSGSSGYFVGPKPVAQWISSPSSPNNTDGHSYGSLVYDVQFDQAITGLQSEDFLNQGTAQGCDWTIDSLGSPLYSYRLTISGCGEGTVIPVLKQNSVQNTSEDHAGPESDLAAPAVQIDRTPPKIIWKEVVVPGSSYNFRTSEPVSNLTSEVFTNYAGGTCNFGLTKVDALNYHLEVSACSTPTITPRIQELSVHDQAGNIGPENYSTPLRIVLNNPPSAPDIDGELDYALGLSAYLPQGGGLPYTTDSLSNTGDAKDCQLSFDVASETVHVHSCSNGSFQLRIKAGSVTDDSGNVGPSQDVLSPVLNLHFPKPQLSFTQMPASVTTEQTLHFVVNSNTKIVDLQNSDWLNKGTAKGCRYAVTSTGGHSYSLQVSGCSRGTLKLGLKANSITTANHQTGPDQDQMTPKTVHLVDNFIVPTWTTPRHTIKKAKFNLTLTFPHSIVGLQGADFKNSGTARGCRFSPRANHGAQIILEVSGCSDGTVHPVLKRGTVGDNSSAVRWPLQDTPSKTFRVDRHGPRARWFGPYRTNQSGRFGFLLSFSEPILHNKPYGLQIRGNARRCKLSYSAVQTNAANKEFNVWLQGCSRGKANLRIDLSQVKDRYGNKGPRQNLSSGSIRT